MTHFEENFIGLNCRPIPRFHDALAILSHHALHFPDSLAGSGEMEKMVSERVVCEYPPISS